MGSLGPVDTDAAAIATEPPGSGLRWTRTNTKREMNKDYRFLIGQRFSVGGEIYVVEDLKATAERTYVQANTPADQPARGTASGDDDGFRIFALSEVLQWLLVDEEIELFNPNFLAAR